LPKTEEGDTDRRVKFYNSVDVARLLSKDGVPKSKLAMISLISKGSSGGSQSRVDPDTFQCLSNVTFAIHPQQINVRDNATGKIIASIEK